MCGVWCATPTCWLVYIHFLCIGAIGFPSGDAQEMLIMSKKALLSDVHIRDKEMNNYPANYNDMSGF